MLTLPNAAQFGRFGFTWSQSVFPVAPRIRCLLRGGRSSLRIGLPEPHPLGEDFLVDPRAG
jgi:hypothetical protein